MQNTKEELHERPRIHSLGRSVTPSLGRKLLFVFCADQSQLDLTKRKMSSNGSANVKHSEAMSDEIITVMSTACGESELRNERGLLGKHGF